MALSSWFLIGVFNVGDRDSFGGLCNALTKGKNNGIQLRELCAWMLLFLSSARLMGDVRYHRVRVIWRLHHTKVKTVVLVLYLSV